MSTTRTKKPDGLERYPLWMRLMIFVGIWFLISSAYVALVSDQRTTPIPYSQFKEEVRQGKVAEVQFEGEEVTGNYKTDGSREQTNADGGADQPLAFKTVLPSINDAELMSLLEKNDVVVQAIPTSGSWLATLFVTLLPWILIIGFFVYINKKMRSQLGSSGGPFGFAKSKAKKFNREDVDVGFDDVAGLDNAKSEMMEMVKYLKDPSQFQKIGAQLPKGILLAGPPGTGKTLMARAVAGEADVPFFSISGSEFIEMFVGVGASRVRDMFKKAKKHAPSLIFIDELDSIGRARGTGIGGGHDEREQTLNQILSEIDGFSPNEAVIVLSATNRPDVLDPALVRPGRFDRQITLDYPQKDAREKILRVHADKVALKKDIDFTLLAASTVGFSGADLKNLVNEAALLAARKGKEQVSMEEFNEGRDKIILGIKREDQLSENEKKTVAYHEAGHALTALVLPGTDPLAKVTIIPRGRSLGATEQVPEEDRHNFSKSYLVNRIAVMLGGRAAEQQVFSEVTSGAGDDLKQATKIARRMVCQWGMSEKIGLMALNKGDPHPFLGRELAEEKDYSEATAKDIDDEIRQVLQQAYEKAESVIADNREKLETLAQELIARETLTAAEIEKLLEISSDDTR